MQIIVWKIGTHDCTLCKKLNGVWGEIKERYPDFTYCVANPLLDNKVADEMKRHNLKYLPVIKIQQGTKIIYRERISSVSEFEKLVSEVK